ncbi:MAG: recombinase family protein [Pseudomonadota bacterium]
MPRKKSQQPSSGILIGYARVSTKDQSTKQQVDALRKHGVVDDNIFVETVSGVSHRRPRLEEAMAKCDPGDTFVVWKFDRFGRSIVDLLKRMQVLEDKGVGFVSLTDQIDTTTPAGRLMVHMLAAIAQFERDMISERTRAGMQHKIRTEGYRPGPTPKLDGAPRTRAQELRNEGLSVPQIVTQLIDEYGIKVSAKTLYNQTVAPVRPKSKRKK